MSATPILVINSGSSSLKFGLFEAAQHEIRPLARGSADGIGSDRGKVSLQSADGKVLYEQQQAVRDQPHALGLVAAQLSAHGLPAAAAVGHRIVHGGPALREHQKITPRVLEQLEAAAHFAPLHVPAAVALIRETQRLFPGIPEFACFDTAFHRTLPEAAARFPLPARFWNEGVRRYGFHGLSCESILHTLGAARPARLIVAHLGNGASITGIADGCSVDTTMGLTPTGGIIMGTRCGDIDPGVLLYILRSNGNSAAELEILVDRQSGLLGISGESRDMRLLHQASDAGARLAIEMFARSAKKAIAGFAAVLGALDLLVFTGGIGEHDPAVRAGICEGLQCFGVHLDEPANQRGLENISSAQSQVLVRILPSEEEIQIARHTYRLLSA